MMYVSLDCSLCGFMLRDSGDAERFIESQCCIDCWESFLRPMRVIQEDDTYLPSETILDGWRDKVRKQNDLIKQG